jgi:uncharacterized protein (DUF362 family)
MKTSRRDFIKAAGAATFTLIGGSIPVVNAELSKSEIYVGKGSAADIIPKLLAKMGGMGRFVKAGARVVIKPNMAFANPPDWATTTSPEAVYTVVKLCLDAGAKRVIIADYTLREPELCKQKTGIVDAVKGLKGVVVFTPTTMDQFVEKTSDKAKALTKTLVLKEVLSADTFISLPTAKAHGAGGVSFNMKGLMGCVWDRGIMHSGMDLHMAIPEQLYYMKPHLNIVDASRALLDNGPAGPGQVAKLDTFVAGIDPVAVDSYGVTLASWYGKKFEGKQVAHIRNAAMLGFGNAESNMISEIMV